MLSNLKFSGIRFTLLIILSLFLQSFRFLVFFFIRFLIFIRKEDFKFFCYQRPLKIF